MTDITTTDNEPNLLRDIQVLQAEMMEHVNRIKGLSRQGKLDHETLTSEFAETFLPLLQDTVDKMFQVQYLAQRFGDDVAAKLWPDGEEDPSGLWPEDAEVFKALLTDYKHVVSASLEHLDGVAKKESEKKIALIDKALVRINELTLSEDAPPDEHEDEEDDNENDEEEDVDKSN
jgi:hypothetical protein